jgi:hypothetical protein
MATKMTLEQKFTFLLAKKLRGKDVKPEMDTLSEADLIRFKEWVAEKKESAEYEIWKRKQAERAEDAEG